MIYRAFNSELLIGEDLHLVKTVKERSVEIISWSEFL